MPADKPTNSYRIFLLGESAALGDPDPAYGFGRYLEVLLRKRYPDTRFDVICVAMTAINSHAILPIARECARHQGDLWIIYMGNNEMMGPYGAGAVFGLRAPRLGLIRASLALKTTRVGQMLDAFLGRLGSRESSPDYWQGMKTFASHKIRPDDTRKQRVYENFRRNLDDILRVGEDAGLKVLLSTVASNLKDCGPFASLHASGLNEQQRQTWEQLYSQGSALESLGEFSRAIDKYSQAAQIDNAFAELQFRLGRCYLLLTNSDQARRCFELSRDLDGLPFRTDSNLNAIIKRTGSENDPRRVRQLDAVKALSEQAPQGSPGSELFYEHVHLNFEGNYLLARAMAQEIAGILPQAITSHAAGEWASSELCDSRLALTDWNRFQVYESILARVSDAPFTNQLAHLSRAKMYSEKLSELKSRMTPGSFARAQGVYRAALAERPDDYLIREKFAEFLEMTGRLTDASAEWQRACELLPHHFMPFFRLGKLRVRQGKFQDAEILLSHAVTMRPDFVEGLNELGRSLFKQGKLTEALTCHENALRQQPANAITQYHIAGVLAAQGKREEALKSLREAVRLRPGFWEARYLLGVELALRGDIPGAKGQFSEVVRLNPRYALAHLNLGVALANEGRIEDALAEFQETLRLDPGNKSAQQRIEGLRLLQRRGR
jgi:tetratricopeptide (TPR) repeat protein